MDIRHICPHCNKDFEEGYWECEYGCLTLYCLNCDDEVYIYKGEMYPGHDPCCSPTQSED